MLAPIGRGMTGQLLELVAEGVVGLPAGKAGDGFVMPVDIIAQMEESGKGRRPFAAGCLLNDLTYAFSPNPRKAIRYPGCKMHYFK